MSYPTKKLWEICKFQNWFAFKSWLFKDKWFPILRISNIQDNNIFYDKLVYFDKNDYEKDLSNYIVKKWDLVIAMSWATTWKLAINNNDEDFYLNQRVWKFIFDNDITKKYTHFLLSTKIQENLNQSVWSAIPNLSTQQINDIPIPLPSLPIQKLIVQKLDLSFEKIDKSIELTKKNLENLKELNKSVLEWIFENRSYYKVKLLEITTIVWWGTPKTNILEYWWDDIVWLSPTDLPAIWEIVNISDSQKKISKLWIEKSSAKLLPIWTVIYSSRATIWKIAINDTKLSTNQGFASFICSDKIYNYYLAYTLKYYTDDIVWLSNSTTFKEVNKTNLKNFEIPLPSLPKQKEIVSYLDKVFEKNKVLKEKYEKKLKDLEEMKQSILKEAFEARLVKE